MFSIFRWLSTAKFEMMPVWFWFLSFANHNLLIVVVPHFANPIIPKSRRYWPIVMFGLLELFASPRLIAWSIRSLMTWGFRGSYRTYGISPMLSEASKPKEVAFNFTFGLMILVLPSPFLEALLGLSSWGRFTSSRCFAVTKSRMTKIIVVGPRNVLMWRTPPFSFFVFPCAITSFLAEDGSDGWRRRIILLKEFNSGDFHSVLLFSADCLFYRLENCQSDNQSFLPFVFSVISAIVPDICVKTFK